VKLRDFKLKGGGFSSDFSCLFTGRKRVFQAQKMRIQQLTSPFYYRNVTSGKQTGSKKKRDFFFKWFLTFMRTDNTLIKDSQN